MSKHKQKNEWFLVMDRRNKKNEWFLVIDYLVDKLPQKVYFVKNLKNSEHFIDGAALVYYPKNVPTTRNIAHTTLSSIRYNPFTNPNHIGLGCNSDYNKKYLIYHINKTDSVVLENTMFLIDKWVNQISLRKRSGNFNYSILSLCHLAKCQRLRDIKLASYYNLLDNIIAKSSYGRYNI